MKNILTLQNIEMPSFRFAWHFAKIQLKTKYRYTALGFMWNFLEPALYLIILSLVFSVINRMNISDYAVFLFSALIPWRYFEKVVNTVMESFVNGEWLIKKMYVSPFALAYNKWVTAGFEFLFSIIVAFTLFAFLKEEWTAHLLIIPVAIIPWALIGFGIGLCCAVLYTFFRDVKPFVQMLLTLTFFTSPILFNSNIFEEGSLQHTIMEIHPVTYFASLFQKPIYEAALPAVSDWIISLSLAFFFIMLGVYQVNKYKSKFYFYI